MKEENQETRWTLASRSLRGGSAAGPRGAAPPKANAAQHPVTRPSQAHIVPGLAFLLVVEDYVWDQDHLRRTEDVIIAEIGRVQAQLVVAPLLCVGREFCSGPARERGSLGKPRAA